ncbi:transcriptional regulator [Couchioplanes azureus]|uniref:transcriptional regulator n=1 Tax=Couchioplanes caeruleus TaxID=56438 RepID=UPI001E3CDB52|nr:transcriptional regulator [Couchioplanes caeruleus]
MTAQALFEGRADLNGYPFHLLGVVSQRGTGMENLSAALAGAEMLLPYGWELVNVAEFTNSNHACAVMRRRKPA